MEFKKTKKMRKLEELSNELYIYIYYWNSIGLSEIRWIGNREVITKIDNKFIYSGFDKKHGVAFLVNKELKIAL